MGSLTLVIPIEEVGYFMAQIRLVNTFATHCIHVTFSLGAEPPYRSDPRIGPVMEERERDGFDSCRAEM